MTPPWRVGSLPLFTFTAGGGSPTSANWFVDGVAVSSGPTTYTYKAVGVGKHSILCKSSTPNGLKMGGLSFAAIGGPLVTSITAGFGGGGQTPTNDTRDNTKALYIQYFGYFYDGTKPDPDLQTPQTGNAQSSGQLAGTTYSWSVVGNASIISPLTPDSQSISISATGSSGSGSIRAKCTFTYTDPSDTTLTGSADDDTEELPDALAHRFTAHMPSTTKEILQANVDGGTITSGMVPTSTQFPNNYISILQLKDHLGQGMSGVMVQERFPDLSTEVKGHYDPITGQYDHPNSVSGDEAVNDEFTYWVTFQNLFDSPSTEGLFGGSGSNGYELKVDMFGLVLPYDSDPTGPNTWPFASHIYPWVSLTQQYIAGTRNPTPGAMGVNVGTWTIKKWSDKITHG